MLEINSASFESWRVGRASLLSFSPLERKEKE